MTKAEILTEIRWAENALEAALKTLWQAEQTVHDKRVALAKAHEHVPEPRTMATEDAT